MVTHETSLDEFDTALAAGAKVLDVREGDEYAEGHVPAARLMPLATVPMHADELRGGSPVYIICASGARSAQAVEVLQQLGVEARSVAGGTSAWIRSGRAVATGAPGA